MINIDDPLNTNYELIPVDPFWNIGIEQEQKMHRIHTYPAKFPAFITTKTLEYAKTNSLNVRVLADIFCGCGTTAYEAKRNNINFWGCDINPVATMIAKTKSRKYQNGRLESYLQEILDKYSSTASSNNYENANERLKYWYREDEYNSLFHLKNIIEEITPEKSDYRRFFICAFSNILKPTSVWLAKSIKPQVDPEKKPANVIKAFKNQCLYMIIANNQSNLSNTSTTIIETSSILDQNLQTPKVDLIITSPPYVTSYEYADLHQLSTLWLSYATDYRELRKGSIGSSHSDFNFNKEWKRLNTTGTKIVSRLLNQDKSKAHSVTKYFLDIQEVIKKTYSMLNNSGMALFVIANTEYKGVIVDNAKHLSESLFNTGFSEIYATKRKISNKILTPYRDAAGKFSSDSSGRLVYSEEFIIIGKR